MKLKVLLTGATGMIGRGVLLECLKNDDVASVLSIGRSPSGEKHPKLEELILKDFKELENHAEKLKGYNACFYCLGTSAAGISEEEYHRVTYGMTKDFADALVNANSALVFIYISATGADSTEKGKSSWARIKGKTENMIFGKGFQSAYMFRPGFIEPLDGITSRTALYRWLYILMKPVTPLFKKLMPDMVTDTRRIGQAMISISKHGYNKTLLENIDINDAAKR